MNNTNRRTSFDLPDDLWEKAKNRATKLRLSLGKYLRKLIENDIDHDALAREAWEGKK